MKEPCKNCNRLGDIDVNPVPKVRKPKLTARQLALFKTDEKS